VAGDALAWEREEPVFRVGTENAASMFRYIARDIVKGRIIP